MKDKLIVTKKLIVLLNNSFLLPDFIWQNISATHCTL